MNGYAGPSPLKRPKQGESTLKECSRTLKKESAAPVVGSVVSIEQISQSAPRSKEYSTNELNPANGERISSLKIALVIL
jgi:hypothetical protein